MASITLVSSDGIEYLVLADITKQSKTLYDLIEATGSDVIHLAGGVEGAALAYVISYCLFHAADTEPPPMLDLSKPRIPGTPIVVGYWDSTFCIDCSDELVWKINHAANYLDVRPLVDLMAYTIAMRLLDMTHAQIYAQFDITEPITAEEEAQILKENPWLSDNPK